MVDKDRERKDKAKNLPSKMKKIKRWSVCSLCGDKYPTVRGHICKKRK
jgi:hypothetical protein